MDLKNTLIHKLQGVSLFVSLGVFMFAPYANTNNNVLGAVEIINDDYASQPILLTTKSSFAQKEVSETEVIDFSIVYEDDQEREYGEEKVAQEGIDGQKTFTYLVTFWKDEIISKELLRTEVTEPTSKIISVGKKIIWRTVKTELGELKYWRKLHVFATKYDGNCVGCRGLTYSGTLVRKGVCAVDPKVISLGTNFYVEGYGMCRSEDIGGLIKGNRIDLGFEKASEGTWGAAYTNIYLLTSAPSD